MWHKGKEIAITETEEKSFFFIVKIVVACIQYHYSGVEGSQSTWNKTTYNTSCITRRCIPDKKV
jgi:hypothetical protein